jgi:dTDP-4-dehydrorhamnose 3,5-epimerase
VDIEALSLQGLKLIRPRVFRDARGFFLESYHAPRFEAAGMSSVFVQDNHSRSVKDTLRGLHYQSSPGQAKLLRVVSGRIFDVAVDIRPSGLARAGKFDAKKAAKAIRDLGLDPDRPAPWTVD